MVVSEILKNVEISSNTPRLDLELLLVKAIEKKREFLYTDPDYQLDSQQLEIFQSLCERRNRGEPIAYILGKKEFWSLEFTVNEKVLIPRPETEILVEIILEKIKKEEIDVADLGTGSGAVALALAKERPSWRVVATDVSCDALQVASYNAMELMIQNIEFYCGDWCSALPERRFDVIVSNPPYIKRGDPHLGSGDLLFEPRSALESGDGLDAIREIILQVKDKLNPEGFLVIEHGYNQSEKVVDLLRGKGYQNIETYKDLVGIDRAVVASIGV